LDTTLFAVKLQVKGNLRNSQYKFVVGTFRVSGVKKSVINRVVSSVLKSSLVGVTTGYMKKPARYGYCNDSCKTVSRQS